jgi:parvulin-like peptidyl-prolyl isomerase
MTFYRLKFIVPMVLAASSVAFSQQGADKVLAKIGEKTITLDEFNKRFEQNSRLVPGKVPSKDDVLKNIIYFELAIQDARRLNIHREDSLKDQFDVLLYQAYVRRFIQPIIDKLQIPESEVRDYYKMNPLIRTSHIVVLSKPGMTEAEKNDLKARANDIWKQVTAGKKAFKDLAREYSEGPSAKTGGDVDWGGRHKLLPEYYDPANALKNIGDVSAPIETPYGLHIIKLTGRKPYSEIDSVYKDFIVRTLRESKGQEKYNEYFATLQKKSSVFVNEGLLKQ